MQNFTQYTPTEIVFGSKTHLQAGIEVKKWNGHRVLIVYGGGSVVKSGLLETIENALREEKITYEEFGGVKPNPRLAYAERGVQKALEFGADFILAVGGGSSIDTAKAIAHGAANPGTKLWDIWTQKVPLTRSLPMGCVLTIAAAGSEMSSSSVLTNEETGEKSGITTVFNRPKFAIMNPELTFTLPPYQIACGVVDIMMHTMERYFSRIGNMELTDALAEGLLRTVMENARILMKEPSNYDARAEIMWAGSLSHNGLTGCGGDGGDWMPHKLEHEIGGLFDVAHGAGLAAVWGSWARYVYLNCLPRFRKFAIRVCGVEEVGTDEEIAKKGIEAMEAFLREIKMPTNLSELGIHPSGEELRDMARKCAEGVGGAKGSAKVLREADMLAILEAANQSS